MPTDAVSAQLEELIRQGYLEVGVVIIEMEIMPDLYAFADRG